ncbi:MAG: ComF family protein, partial [Candidatus Moranbacteria bacterium]|nr:ComF family protein [Candidatus Moranbacteria bacterium]
DFQLCPVCEKNITEKGALCPDCKDSRKSFLNAIIAAVSYENPAVKKLIYNLKYRFISASSEPLSELMIKALLRNDLPIPDFIVPVPLHPRRLRWRGFNQSRLLAEKISKNLAPMLEIEVMDVLKRDKNNKAQMKIKKYRERLQNIKDIFSFDAQFGKNILKNKEILLIDDIATTGATLEECAKILKENGAKKVYGAVIARQTIK